MSEELTIAIEDEDIEAVKQQIADGADVNAKDDQGWTPLNTAAAVGHKEIVELLIAKGADVNARNDDGYTPLHNAANQDRSEIAELLIAEGVDVNAKDGGETSLDKAIMNEYTKTADLLRKHGGKSGAEDSIHVAAKLGCIDAVKKHLAAGADVNVKDEDESTPLHHAAIYGRNDVAELLISKGADVNAKNKIEITALHFTANNKETAELLIAKGADVNAKDEDENTPLLLVTLAGDKETAKLLITKGADVNASTPLLTAVNQGHKEIVELLIDKGADVNVKDEYGETSLDTAIMYEHTETADLLREHGGKTADELKAAGK